MDDKVYKIDIKTFAKTIKQWIEEDCNDGTILKVIKTKSGFIALQNGDQVYVLEPTNVQESIYKGC